MDLTLNCDINIMGVGRGKEARNRIKTLIYQDRESTN